MSLLWHLGKGSQGPVDLGIEPTEAERFFKERGIKYQFIDMKEKE